MSRAAFVALISMGAASAQDECASAAAVATGATPFDTTTATPSVEPWSCVSGAAGDLWFTYTAVGAFGLRFETCGSTYDTAMEVYTGTCGALVLVECNDDACSLQSAVDIAAQVAGTAYTIRVGGFASSSGLGTLTVTDNISPPWDECMGALAVADGMTPFDLGIATTSADPWSCGLNVANDLWYSYTAIGDGPASFETCGATFDTVIEAFSGDCGALVSEACNDDFCSLQSGVSFNVNRGETYLIRVGGWNGASGTGDLTVAGPGYPVGCVETIFAANNGGAVGGVAYMDMTVSQDVTFSGLGTNYDVLAGDPVGIEMWITPGTWTGGRNEDISLWTMVATDDGLAVSNGNAGLSAINFSAPVFLPAGSYGVALISVGDGHRYTTGGTGFQLQYASADGVVSLDLGGGANTPFSTQLFFPRVWNGEFCHETLGTVGTTYCGPAAVNSTGAAGTIAATGSDVVADDALVLTASNLPAHSFGFFLASTAIGSSMPGGSSGVLCLGGPDIGRGVGGRILRSSTGGVFGIGSDLSAIPHASLGSVPVMVGDTWYFQAWYRDAIGGVTTSNFTDAVCITYL